MTRTKLRGKYESRVEGLERQLAVRDGALKIAEPALLMAKRVLNDESQLGDIEASFEATDMIDKALAAIEAGKAGE